MDVLVCRSTPQKHQIDNGLWAILCGLRSIAKLVGHVIQQMYYQSQHFLENRCNWHNIQLFVTIPDKSLRLLVCFHCSALALELGKYIYVL